MGAVLGFVHRDHGVVEHRAHDLGEDLGRVRLVVAQHSHHFVVAEHIERRVAFLIEGPHVVGEWPLELHGPLPAGGSEVRIGVVGGAELDCVGQLERIETRGHGAVVDCQFNRSLRRRAASSAPSMATPGIPIGI